MTEVTQTVVEVNAEEKIGLPSYSNVTIGARISKTYDGPIDEEVALKDLASIVEGFVASERQVVLDSLQKKS